MITYRSVRLDQSLTITIIYSYFTDNAEETAARLRFADETNVCRSSE